MKITKLILAFAVSVVATTSFANPDCRHKNSGDRFRNTHAAPKINLANKPNINSTKLGHQ